MGSRDLTEEPVRRRNPFCYRNGHIVSGYKGHFRLGELIKLHVRILTLQKLQKELKILSS